MIKLFENDERVNFVDDNNMLCGMDMEQNCCEVFGYITSDGYENENFTGNVIPLPEKYSHINNEDDDNVNRAICFELTNNGYIILWNSHNGYYSHEYEFKDGETIMHGWL